MPTCCTPWPGNMSAIFEWRARAAERVFKATTEFLSVEARPESPPGARNHGRGGSRSVGTLADRRCGGCLRQGSLGDVARDQVRVAPTQGEQLIVGAQL